MGSTLHNCSCSNGNLAIPGHQQQFFEESCKDLTEEQRDNMAKLLIKYEEGFRNTTFTGIQLTVDAVIAKPTKQ